MGVNQQMASDQTTTPDFPRLLFSLTSWQLLTLARRYEGARNYIQGFYYPERKKPHVIRDMRRIWSAQIIYDTDDEEAFRDKLQIEYMRYAMEAANDVE